MNTVEFNYQQLFLKDWRTISFLISFLARSGFCSNLFSTLNPQNDEMWKFGQSEADALCFLIDSFLTDTQIWWTGFWSLVLVLGLETTLKPKTQLIFIKSYFNLFLEMFFPNLQVQQGRNFIFMSLLSLKVHFTSRAVIGLKWKQS